MAAVAGGARCGEEGAYRSPTAVTATMTPPIEPITTTAETEDDPAHSVLHAWRCMLHDLCRMVSYCRCHYMPHAACCLLHVCAGDEGCSPAAGAAVLFCGAGVSPGFVGASVVGASVGATGAGVGPTAPHLAQNISMRRVT